MDDRPRVDIVCDRCSKKTQKLLRWLETHAVFTCLCGEKYDCAEILDQIEAAPPNPNPGYPHKIKFDI